MTTLFAGSATSVVLWIVIKASILLAATAFVQVVLGRRASAATRHGVWLLCLACLIVLPVIATALPEWPIAIHVTSNPPDAVSLPNVVRTVPLEGGPLSAPAIGVQSVSTLSTEEASVTPSWFAIIAGVYSIGALGLLMFLAVQRRSLRRLAASATIVRDPDWIRTLNECAATMSVGRTVQLVRSRERNVPMAFGTRRPTILIAAIADLWAEDRRRAVLLHELAHVARYDCLTHTMATVASAMYWFHPAVWWVARRVRLERELACDDRVIAAGTGAREYAGHLLEIAYSFGGHRAPALAVTMARPRQLEGRMLAALDAARNRRLPSFRTRIALAAAATVLLVSVAVAMPALTPVIPAEPPAPSDVWLAPDEQPRQEIVATTEAAKRITKQELKDIADLPLLGLKEVGAGVRALAGAFGVPQENTPGTWEIRPTDTKGVVHLRIVERNSSNGTNVAIEQLEGLTGAQLTGPGGPVKFTVRRDAGTFNFEGVMRSGVGAGTFTFILNPNFAAELAKRGFTKPTEFEQYQLARHDVGYAFLDELNRQGYTKPQTADLVRAGQHGVQATYLREMGALGYRLGTLDPLITLRDHGVTPDYVRQMAELGYKGLSADEIQKARDHGVTPEYVRAMRDGGYGSLPLAEIINAKDHGVSAEYIRGMRDAGYGSIPLPELVNLRDHGVTPEFVRELAAAGYTKLPLDMLLRIRDHGVSAEYVRGMKGLGYSLAPDELVRARDHGVTVEYVRDLAALGYEKQPMDALIRLKDHGVTPEYARDLKALGYDKLSLEDLTTLRDYGLTADRIRSANSRAGSRLPVDMLKSLAAGGMR
jgi:beta-lactamase regulating signal transducer with metallopeptidase domain